MNILSAGNKSPAQRGFFHNSVGDLLATLSFLDGLYNFCNFVIIFSLIKSQWYIKSDIYYGFGNDWILPKICTAKIAGLRKLKIM